MKSRDFFNKYIECFLEENSKINLISKNDEKLLWKKHIFDSLSIEKVFDEYKNISVKTLIDIGTGGGFPAVPIAIAYKDIEVFALDSIRKKIFAVENIKSKLGLNNLHTICDRAENIKEKFDIVTSRAVAPLKKVLEYGIPLMNQSGTFIAYKSLKVKEEIEDSKQILKKLNCFIDNIIEYDLPLRENYTRNLVIVKKFV